MRTRVKICGLCSPESATAAVAAGADAIGLVFYAPSPRAVEVEMAARIVSGLPPYVSSVGLFVNPARRDVLGVLDQVPLDMLQFHGEEDDVFCSSFERPYYKALGVNDCFDLRAAEAQYPHSRGLLLDAYDPVLKGGTGRSFDWARFPEPVSKPLILAGGLTPENVGKAIRQTQPYAVDVSGGVESARGVKDNELIKAFVREVMREHATGF